MSECYNNTASVLQSLDACHINSMTMGNDNTSHISCGLDPYRNITHIAGDPSFHYPGCGIFPKDCTNNPCCTVAILNNDTKDNCDSTPKSRLVYDPVIIIKII
jgi:hypothetical protein